MSLSTLPSSLPSNVPPPVQTPPPEGAARLTHWGVIRARGADAVKFLQGQLTSDVASLPLDQAQLAGFCSAKGRLQASFLIWKTADEVLMACSATVLAATLKRLSMFVMRAQCRLSDASAELPLWGLAGAPAEAVAPGFAVWQAGALEGARVIRLPDAARQRRVLIVGTPPAGVPTLALDAWRWLEVQSGVATIEAATVEQFVPQMLNYELLGGVDFRKGCYPGQEVVARSQYRGTIKRRSFLFDVDAAAVPGQEVFHSADPEQPAGMVVNAAPDPSSGAFGALVEVKLAVFDGGTLHLGSPAGAVLRRRELPYAVAVDAV